MKTTIHRSRQASRHQPHSDTLCSFTAIHFLVFKGKIKFYSSRQWLWEVTQKIDRPNLTVATGSCLCLHAHCTHLQYVTLMKVRSTEKEFSWSTWFGMHLRDIDLWCRWMLISCIWCFWNWKSEGLRYLIDDHQCLSDRNCLGLLLIVKRKFV